jgi:hypothetical protein
VACRSVSLCGRGFFANAGTSDHWAGVRSGPTITHSIPLTPRSSWGTLRFLSGSPQREAVSSSGKAAEAKKEDLASPFTPSTWEAGAPGQDDVHEKEEASPR